jgi:peptidoglycan/xylan/chitin deacetylase (PgdA/CDA1 family)
MTGKIVIKRMVSELLSSCGAHTLIEHFRFSDKAFVLMYHRVLNSVDSQMLFVQPGMFVTTSSFEKQVVFLKKRFEVVFLEDLVEKVLNGESNGGLCAITFDDGWRDNYTDAFSVLKKYSIPATIFLATGFVGTNRIFWPEEICYYLDRSIANKLSFDGAPLSLVRFNKEISSYDPCKQESHFERSIEILKEFSQNEREEILRYFRGMFRIDPPPRQMLNWDEVCEMHVSGLVRFGAHTVNHEILDKVPLLKAREEISKSREEIENHLGIRISTFAYPNGNNNGSLQKMLAESGYNAAVTTRKGFLERGMPRMEIPRIAIHEDVSNTIPMFRSRILFKKF